MLIWQLHTGTVYSSTVITPQKDMSKIFTPAHYIHILKLGKVFIGLYITKFFDHKISLWQSATSSLLEIRAKKFKSVVYIWKKK